MSRTAVIAGVGPGLGASLVGKLAREGCQVGMFARSADLRKNKVAELSNPLDPSSEPTGNTHFILAEVYQSEAGIADHFQKAGDGWEEFENFVKWLGACKTTIIPSAPIIHSLW